MVPCNPNTRSDKNNAANGNASDKRRSEMHAPLKRAIAAIGEKFGNESGITSLQSAAANNIIPKNMMSLIFIKSKYILKVIIRQIVLNDGQHVYTIAAPIHFYSFSQIADALQKVHHYL